jgi:predicted nucleic acid-binding Zn ribbon protein
MDHASRVLPAVLATAIRQAPLTPEKVVFAWRAASGAAIARVTDVTLAEGGVLKVQALDPQWAKEVHRLRHDLVRQLEPWLGTGVVATIEIAGGAARRPRRTSLGTSS